MSDIPVNYEEFVDEVHEYGYLPGWLHAKVAAFLMPINEHIYSVLSDSHDRAESGRGSSWRDISSVITENLIIAAGRWWRNQGEDFVTLPEEYRKHL